MNWMSLGGLVSSSFWWDTTLDRNCGCAGWADCADCADCAGAVGILAIRGRG